MADTTHTVDALFEGKNPMVRRIYDRILKDVAEIGPFTEEPRQGSIHLAHSVTFAGIHPRKDHLILTLRTDGPIEHPRVHLSEHVSANRWHVEIKLADPTDVDDQLREWLTSAMQLV